MPFLAQADMARVAQMAAKVSRELMKLVDEGYDIVTLTASCGLMLKFEWPLILPEDDAVRRLSEAVFDIDEYVVDIARKDGLPPGLQPLPEGVTVHMACHARAQNMGPKAAEMLRLIPDTPVDVIERCSGHGGTFGVVKPTHQVGVKVGRPVYRAVNSQKRGHVASDCPLAAMHIVAHSETGVKEGEHPIQIMARAFGLME
jgi:glycerol-3-phosphate dehydrogenase subunit C